MMHFPSPTGGWVGLESIPRSVLQIADKSRENLGSAFLFVAVEKVLAAVQEPERFLGSRQHGSQLPAAEHPRWETQRRTSGSINRT